MIWSIAAAAVKQFLNRAIRWMDNHPPNCRPSLPIIQSAALDTKHTQANRWNITLINCQKYT
jgi:hypothetical protein